MSEEEENPLVTSTTHNYTKVGLESGVAKDCRKKHLVNRERC